MAYIYQITNDINGKIYVGKTERSIEERFKEHCKDSKRREFEKRPLYRAMNKYGTEHFHIELLEETDKPEEREVYWIEQKRSFKNGYNATLGGEGTRYIDYDLVIATYKEVQNQNEVARRLNISSDTVHSVLKNNHIDTIPSSTAAAVATGKIVNQYDLQGNYIQSFLSSKAAAESLGKITATSNGASSHISEVCRGKRKTAYGFIWKFAE
jgi:hypothetical protein